VRNSSTLRALALVAGLAGCAPRAETRLEIDWSKQMLAPGAQLVSCGADCSALSVRAAAQAGPIQLLRIEQPPLDRKRWAIQGRIRYEGVTAPGYLELWNFFGDGSRYFSRTLADSGPMARIAGDSDWRAVLLPFDATQASAPLVQLELNAVLPGGGKVEIEPLRLVQF
jgi:hypothetical protein